MVLHTLLLKAFTELQRRIVATLLAAAVLLRSFTESPSLSI